MNYKDWLSEKNIKDSDLIFTQSLKKEIHQELFKKAADQITQLRPTYSEGLQLLEVLTDLVLMGHDEVLFENSALLEVYKKHLLSLRYPVTQNRDEDLKKKYEQLPWPAGAKIKFERRGDRAGVELKLFISNPTDLTKAIAALERVQQELNK